MNILRFLISSLLVLKEGADGLERTEKEAQRLHFIQAGPPDGTQSAPTLSLDEETYRTVLRHFLLNTPSELLGQRTSEEIEARLLNKLRGDRPEQVSRPSPAQYITSAHQQAAAQGALPDHQGRHDDRDLLRRLARPCYTIPATFNHDRTDPEKS